MFQTWKLTIQIITIQNYHKFVESFIRSSRLSSIFSTDSNKDDDDDPFELRKLNNNSKGFLINKNWFLIPKNEKEMQVSKANKNVSKKVS